MLLNDYLVISERSKQRPYNKKTCFHHAQFSKCKININTLFGSSDQGAFTYFFPSHAPESRGTVIHAPESHATGHAQNAHVIFIHPS